MRALFFILNTDSEQTIYIVLRALNDELQNKMLIARMLYMCICNNKINSEQRLAKFKKTSTVERQRFL